ncbi:MAG: DUF2318 domain-containing protein [Oscillospiraceae bacterium]|jgi:hypothetical protein|nr:DUF2318 domain-containing protein [Oscillospiraceae bacterium]
MKKILALMFAVLVLAALAGCGGNRDAADDTTGAADIAAGAPKIEPGESLAIPVAEQTGTVKFYSVNVNDTLMEVMAVKTGDGKVRTAFNTCQVCNGSPYAFFVQKGDVVECQNCGNQFPMDRVEAEAGGCNPWPIFAGDKTATDTEIQIGYDFLAANTGLFTNWKVGIS